MFGLADLPVWPLFLGPAELLILGIVLLVLVFGSRAPEFAGSVGESLGSLRTKKRKLDEEIDDLKGTPDEIREDLGVDDDLQEIQEGIEDVERSIDPDAEITEGDETSQDPKESS